LLEGSTVQIDSQLCPCSNRRPIRVIDLGVATLPVENSDPPRLQEMLPIFNKGNCSVCMPYGDHRNPDRIALGLAASTVGPARIFRVVSDMITPEDAAALLDALQNCKTVVVFGGSESKFVADLAYYWPDYCKYRSECSVSAHLVLPAKRSDAALACVYVLVPNATSLRRSARSWWFKLTSSASKELASRARGSTTAIEVIGQIGEGLDPMSKSMRELCFLHERDAPSAALEQPSADATFTWGKLQKVLQLTPEWLLEAKARRTLPSEMHSYGLRASKFIEEMKQGRAGGVYPDIYSAVWFNEQIAGWIFRGQYRADWGLESSLLRAPREGGPLELRELVHRTELTSLFLATLKQHAADLLGAEPDEPSLLAIAQHFGFPTPLLDFTRSFRTAAFFATLPAQALRSDTEPPIGVIFHVQSSQSNSSLLRTPGVHELSNLAGLRIGSEYLIQPKMAHVDDRIRRQQGVFLAGYRARDLQQYVIDRIYFRQTPQVVFEDPRAAITRDELLPDRTPLTQLAESTRQQFATRQSSLNTLLGNTPINSSNLIGSSGANAFWHIHQGSQYLELMTKRAVELGSQALASSLKSIIGQFFAMAKVQADIGPVPMSEGRASQIEPVKKVVASLADAVGASAQDFLRLLLPWAPTEWQESGRITFDIPQSWTDRQRLGFSCALFCIAWEHLRTVRGSWAENFVGNALIHLCPQANDQPDPEPAP
jgi:hypothetical protein